MSTLFNSTPAAAPNLAARVEAHCRACFASWDGYQGLGGVTKQHFTEEQREHWRETYRQVLEVHQRAEALRP